MRHLIDAVVWLTDPAHLMGDGGVLHRAVEHLTYSVVAVAIACLIAVPVGWLVGHSGRFDGLTVATTGTARALPTLGVLTLAGLAFGVGLFGPMVAFVILSVPSILAGAYAGIRAIEPATIDAARATGLSPSQVLWRVEVPLGLPLLTGGIRSAMLQVIATATLAAYVGAGGLGRQLFLGLRTQDYPQMLGAALAVMTIALIVDLVFAWLQRRVTPAGIRTP
ncbi:ABC transporter permease [Tessaracoccus sp. ZS01]|uniref:ABC transporter permease n=1 Tax=Tessaracoccus sp. ZS01 TaxID=1906324 RepID=UPI00096E5B30|nr:ABC transporter permease [Tessaracoccus sp. ZS01]MCG6567009.1 ABC transporter permease [Tessaracoccus sp. ZS01]OMG57589.1 ABC transporter permease [Tessaracoccus sp. ZS01]